MLVLVGPLNSPMAMNARKSTTKMITIPIAIFLTGIPGGGDCGGEGETGPWTCLSAGGCGGGGAWKGPCSGKIRSVSSGIVGGELQRGHCVVRSSSLPPHLIQKLSTSLSCDGTRLILYGDSISFFPVMGIYSCLPDWPCSLGYVAFRFPVTGTHSQPFASIVAMIGSRISSISKWYS